MKRYLFTLFVAMAALLALVAGAARFVDPYAYWDTADVAGINTYRPASGKHLYVVKQRQFARLKPNTLVVGNSRVDVGIDPASEAWSRGILPVYNMGLPGRGTESVVNAAEEALYVHTPNAVFVGVDFLDFRISEAEWRAPVKEPAPRAPSLEDQIKLKTKLLLSLDALTDTLSSLAEQRARFPAHITRAGYNGLGEYNAIVAAEGHHALFAQRNAENLKSYMRGPKQVQWGDIADSSAMQALERLAALAKRRKISLALFTYPYHGDLLLGIDKAGLWPAYEDWIRGLAAFSERTKVPIYLFTHVDDTTTEPVPESGDRKTKMKWYWEGGHFKAALGDRMISAMMQVLDGKFVLNAETADAYLTELRAGIDAYAEQPAARQRLAQAQREAAK